MGIHLKLIQQEKIFIQLIQDARMLSSLAKAQTTALKAQSRKEINFIKAKTAIRNKKILYRWKQDKISLLIEQYADRISLVDVQTYFWKIKFHSAVMNTTECIHCEFSLLSSKAKAILKQKIGAVSHLALA